MNPSLRKHPKNGNERKKADGKSSGESDEQYQKKLTELDQELTTAQANVELAEDEV